MNKILLDTAIIVALITVVGVILTALAPAFIKYVEHWLERRKEK